MVSPSRRLPLANLRIAVVLGIVVTFALPGLANTFNAFGPQKYQRDTSTPQTVSATFSIFNPNTQYTLHVANSGIASAVITLNGTQILDPSDFNANVTVLDRPVSLQLTNRMDVEVRSEPGSSLTIAVIGVDNDPPVIHATASPTANAAGWNNSNVTITFACSDATSGVAVCPVPI